MSDVNQLRADYEKAFGKKPFNGWDADELKSRIAAGAAPAEVRSTPTPRPVPSQAKVDEIREETTPAEPAAKPKKPAATSDDPFPTQADLDAMRAGTFKSYLTR